MMRSKVSEFMYLTPLMMNAGQSMAMPNSMAVQCDPRARQRRESARRAADKMTTGIPTKKTLPEAQRTQGIDSIT